MSPNSSLLFCGGHLSHLNQSQNFGPSGVRAPTVSTQEAIVNAVIFPPSFLLFYQIKGRQGSLILHGLLSNKTIRISIQQKFGDPPLPPALCNFWVENGGILKSCARVPKLWIWLRRGWGRCLNVTLQTRVPENSASVDGGPSEGSCILDQS